MSTPILASPAHSHNPKPEVIRRTAGYHPSVWGDRFLKYTPEDTMTQARKEQQIEELKEEVRRELMAAAASEPLQELNLIDAVQRLGVAYHFEKDIEEALQHIHEKYHDYDDEDDDGGLHSVSLRFRLLRQQGFDVSCDVFNKFKDDKGNFKQCLAGDMKGMLGLYEATHLMKHGEDILDEAMNFTMTHLAPMATDLSDPLVPQIIHSLKQPLRKGLPRLEARRYISIYEEDGSRNRALLKFAKLDFNRLQSLHKTELSDLTRWWKDLDFARKLPFARDRVVECYFWILGVYFEPQYFLARRILSRVIAMASIIDDTYDAYGTIEELEPFTEAIERWDIGCIDQLPEYMKLCYQALLDVYKEIEEEMAKRDQLYRVHYAKAIMKRLVQAYFVEAKWLQEDYIPTMEEYMPNALVTTGYYMLATTSFVGMGEIVTKEAFDWIFNDPKIVRASALICRLMDDIVSNKFEQERGHVASGIECYMKQHNVTEKQVHNEFRVQLANAWKDINQDCLRPTDVPMPLLTRVLNLARVMDVVYKDEDGYTHVGSETKKRIASLLIDPVPI